MRCYFCGDPVVFGAGRKSGTLGSTAIAKSLGAHLAIWDCPKSADGRHHLGPELASGVEQIEEWLDAGA